MGWRIHFRDFADKPFVIREIGTEESAIQQARELELRPAGYKVAEIRHTDGRAVTRDRLEYLWRDLPAL